jgi:hypothetical protein
MDEDNMPVGRFLITFTTKSSTSKTLLIQGTVLSLASLSAEALIF